MTMNARDIVAKRNCALRVMTRKTGIDACLLDRTVTFSISNSFPNESVEPVLQVAQVHSETVEIAEWSQVWTKLKSTLSQPAHISKLRKEFARGFSLNVGAEIGLATSVH